MTWWALYTGPLRIIVVYDVAELPPGCVDVWNDQPGVFGTQTSVQTADDVAAGCETKARK